MQLQKKYEKTIRNTYNNMIKIIMRDFIHNYQASI